MRVTRTVWFAILTLGLSLNLPAAWAAQGEEVSVAILPFERISNRADDEFLQAGFAETLTTALARVQGLQLVERGQLKRVLEEIKLQHSGLVEEASAVRIGEMVGARRLVLGAYQRAGSSLRVTCRLVDMRTGRVAPEHTVMVTRQLARDEDLFSVQDEVCRALLSSFGIRPTTQETQLVSQVAHAATNVSAYNHYIRAREQYALFTIEGYAQAVSLFEKALAADPKYALAWAGLAETHAGWGFLKRNNGEDPAPDYRRAAECAEKAVALAPDMGDTHRALALVYLNSADALQHRQAVPLLRKALTINPRDAEAHYLLWCALGKALEGEGYTHLRQALAINPRLAAAWGEWGVALRQQGKLDEAVEAYRKAIAINPRNVYALFNLGFLLKRQGKRDDAVRALRLYLDVARDDPAQKEWIPRAKAALRELGTR